MQTSRKALPIALGLALGFGIVGGSAADSKVGNPQASSLRESLTRGVASAPGTRHRGPATARQPTARPACSTTGRTTTRAMPLMTATSLPRTTEACPTDG